MTRNEAENKLKRAESKWTDAEAMPRDPSIRIRTDSWTNVWVKIGDQFMDLFKVENGNWDPPKNSGLGGGHLEKKMEKVGGGEREIY